MVYSDVIANSFRHRKVLILLIVVTCLTIFGNATNHASHRNIESSSRPCVENKPPVNWTSGLRESIYRALIRTNDNDYYLQNHLYNLPIIHLQIIKEQLFGDIVLMAKGQIYQTASKNYKIVQEVCTRPCSSGDNDEKNISTYDEIIGLWTVERIRHHTQHGYGFEFHYKVILRNPYEYQIVKYDGDFDYSLPGHLYIVRLCTVRENVHWSPSYQTTKKVKWDAKHSTQPSYSDKWDSKHSTQPTYLDKWDSKPNVPHWDSKPAINKPPYSVWVHRNIPANIHTANKEDHSLHSVWTHRNAKKLNSLWIHKNVDRPLNHDRHKTPSWYKNVDSLQNTHVSVDQNGVKHIIRFPEFSPEIKDEDIFGELPSPPTQDTTTHKMAHTTLSEEDFLNFSSTEKKETKPNYEQQFNDAFFNNPTTRKNVATTTKQNTTTFDFLATDEYIKRRTTTRSFRKMSPTLPSFILPEAGTTQKRSNQNNTILTYNTFLDEDEDNFLPASYENPLFDDSNITKPFSSTFKPIEDQNFLTQPPLDTFTYGIKNVTPETTSEMKIIDTSKTSTERFDLLETQSFFGKSSTTDSSSLNNNIPIQSTTQASNDNLSRTTASTVIKKSSPVNYDDNSIRNANDSKSTSSTLDQSNDELNKIETSTDNLMTSSTATPLPIVMSTKFDGFNDSIPTLELLPPTYSDKMKTTTTILTPLDTNSIETTEEKQIRTQSTLPAFTSSTPKEIASTTLSNNLISQEVSEISSTTESSKTIRPTTDENLTTISQNKFISTASNAPTENINDLSTTIKIRKDPTTTNKYSETTVTQPSYTEKTTILPTTYSDNFGSRLPTKFNENRRTSYQTIPTFRITKPTKNDRRQTTTQRTTTFEFSTEPLDILKITTQTYTKSPPTSWQDRLLTRKTTQPTTIDTLENQTLRTTTRTRYRNRNRTSSATTMSPTQRARTGTTDETVTQYKLTTSFTTYRIRNRTESPTTKIYTTPTSGIEFTTTETSNTRIVMPFTSEQTNYTTIRRNYYDENITRKPITKPTKKVDLSTSTTKYQQRKPVAPVTSTKSYPTRRLPNNGSTRPTQRRPPANFNDDFLNSNGLSTKGSTKFTSEATLFPDFPRVTTTTQRTQQITPPENDDFLTPSSIINKPNQNIFTPKGTLPAYLDKRYRKTTPRQSIYNRKYPTKARRPFKPGNTNVIITSPSSILQPPVTTEAETTTAIDDYVATKFPIKNTLQPTSETLTSTVPLIISNTIGSNIEDVISTTTRSQSLDKIGTTTDMTTLKDVGDRSFFITQSTFSTTETFTSTDPQTTANLENVTVSSCATCIFNGTFENGTSNFIAISQTINLYPQTPLKNNTKMIPRFSVSTPKNKIKVPTTPIPNCTFYHNHATQLPEVEQTLDDFSISENITSTTRQPFIPRQPRYRKFAVTRHRTVSKQDLDTLSNTHFYIDKNKNTDANNFVKSSTQNSKLFKLTTPRYIFHTERNVEFRTSQSISTSVSINVGKK